MASEYTDLEAAKDVLGTLLVTDLADLNESLTADAQDTETILAMILHVGRDIDARCKAMGYTVPFDDYSGDKTAPDTDPEIHRIATLGFLVQLLLPRHSGTDQYREYKLEYEASLLRLKNGESELTTEDPPSAEDAPRGFKGMAVKPTFAGVDLNEVDSLGNYVDRMRNY